MRVILVSARSLGTLLQRVILHLGAWDASAAHCLETVLVLLLLVIRHSLLLRTLLVLLDCLLLLLIKLLHSLLLHSLNVVLLRAAARLSTKVRHLLLQLRERLIRQVGVWFGGQWIAAIHCPFALVLSLDLFHNRTTNLAS